MSNKQAPLPPNGTRKRYSVETSLLPCSQSLYTLSDARDWMEWAGTQNYRRLRITARLSDGRKLVLP